MRRKILFITSLIILITLSGLSFAEDSNLNETVNMSENIEEMINVENTDNNLLNQNTEPIIAAENDGQFRDLNSEISTKNEINLTKNYIYTNRYDSSLKNGLIIDKELTINGNGHSIDGNGINTIFNIKNNGKLTLNNIYLTNTFTGDTSIIINEGELIFNNVNFTSHRSISKVDSSYFRDIDNMGSLTIINSNFINSTFDITTTQQTSVNNLNIRGFIENKGYLSISNTLFDNNEFKPTNNFGRYPEVSVILFNNAPDKEIILNNVMVTNNKVSYDSSSQPLFKGFIVNENGNLTIINSLFENNTALFSGNSQRSGILYANADKILITNTVFKTNEFNDAIITSKANNLTITKSVFDSNKLTKNLIKNDGSGQLNLTHCIILNNILSTSSSKLFDSTMTSLVKIDENYWGSNDPNFRSISSLSYTPTYIILNVDGPDKIIEPQSIYTIDLTNLNNDEKIPDNTLYDYYINVQSNNLGTITPVDIKNGIGHYIYEPIDKGEDILTIDSIKLKVNVTSIFLKANIDIKTEYENTAYAGTNNTILTRIFVNRDFGIYTVKFYADGIEISESIEELTRTPKEIIFTDNTIRPVNESTVAGANNPKVNYTIKVFGNDELLGINTIIVPLLYNGYLAKNYGYPINDLVFDYNTTVNGDILIQLQDDTTYLSGSSTQKEYEWRTVLSSDSYYTSGFLYIPYNWDKTTTGPYPEFNLIFNGENINNKIIGKYRDQSNIGSFGQLGYGVLIYNVTDCLQNGRNTLKLEKEKDLTAVYPPTLVTFYNTTDSDTLKSIYIKNGADLFYNNYNLANRPLQTTAEFTLSNLNITKAVWYLFAAGASNDEADARFNNRLYKNIWENSTGTNYHAAFISDVTDIIKTTNQATFISTGGTILALQNILVITHPAVKEKTEIKLETEYANTAYAGTNNIITANIKINKTGQYLIKLLADGTEVANMSEYLTRDLMTFYFNDATIRPVDETTVSGAVNRQINYTLEIYQNDKRVAFSTITVPLLYNGYLGKNLAYPNNNLEFNYKTSISGDILIQIQEDDTYLGLNQISRTDNWLINLPENSNIVNSFLYISYNWDKTTTSDYPNLSLIFNGRNIENKLVGKYKDQSNLGSSGKYGYGLLIYDVSDLIYKGQNSLIVKKEKGLTAIYPSCLITVYNTTGSNTLKNIIIDSNADLLYNSYNLANREIQSDNIIELNPLDRTTLYVFASSANNGDADLKVNNNTYSNIWSSYDSTNHNGVYKVDITDIVKATNTIEFISTGGTILATQQIIVTETVINTQNEVSTSTSHEKTPVKTVVKKTTPKLTAKKKTYKVKTKKKKLTATLKNKNGKAIKGVKITFKVKGKKYTAKTNKKGVATVKLNLKKKGKYTVTVKFAGNKLYNSKTIKTKLTIKK